MPKFFEKMKQRSRERAIRDRDIDLNEMVSVREEEPGIVSLHVGDDLDDVLVSKRIGMINEGLRELAKALVEHPRLANVQSIVAVSWIVREHPEILERMGFEVDREHADPYGEKMVEQYKEEDHDLDLVVKEGQRFTTPMFAKISRAAFLQRYGS